jgi:hypothetical protein
MRGKILRYVVKLAQAGDLRPLFDRLLEFYLSAVSPAPNVSGFERALFIDVFLTITRTDAAKQAATAAQLVGPVVAWWTMPETNSKLGSMEGLITTLSSKDRDDFVAALTVLDKCNQRISTTGQSKGFQTAILPSVLGLIHSLHDLYSPTARGRLAAQVRAAVEPIFAPNAAKANNTAETVKCVNHLRELSYGILSVSLCSNNSSLLAEIPGLAESVRFSAFANLGEMSDEHLLLFLRKIVEPLSTLVFATAATTQSIMKVSVLIADFMRVMQQRLVLRWNEAAVAVISTVEDPAMAEGEEEGGGEDDEREEIKRDAEMRSLTNKYLTWLQ